MGDAAGRTIYHMLPQATWAAQSPELSYVAPSLAQEGFIHCTGEPTWLVKVANMFYVAEPGPFVILCIDEAAVDPQVKWEAADGHRFPHIYGPLNLNAVIGVVPFPRNAAGQFLDPGL